MLQPASYEVLIFRHATEQSPYLDWLEALDWKMQERILARVTRMKKGQFGDCKALERGLI